MSISVIPKLEVKLEDQIRVREEARNILVNLIRNRGKDPNAYVIRDLLPGTDLGFPTESWKISYTAANTWETKIDKTLEEDSFIVIFGYENYSASPKTVAIRFYKDIIPIAVVHVEHLNAYQEKVGFFTPLAWGEAEKIKIEFYGNAVGDDNIVLRGFKAELKRKTIG